MHKIKQKQEEAMWLHIRKVDGGFMIIEEFEDEDKSDKHHVCQNIDQMYALIDKIYNK